MEKKLVTRYHLPNHQLAIQDSKPERTRDPEEAEFRRSQRGTGALVLQRQALGLEVGASVLETLEDPRDQNDWANLMGGAMLMSANYHFQVDDEQRMYHALKLPELATQEGVITTPEQHANRIFRSLADLARRSEVLAGYARERRVPTRMSLGVGRQLGNTGLALSVYPWRETSEYEKPYDIQMMARSSAIEMHDSTIALGQELGTVPSVAQISDRLSPLGIHIQRSKTISNAINDAYQQSLERHEAA